MRAMNKSVATMDVPWEELYCEILDFLALLWRNLIYLAYFLFFGPRLLRTVLFFCPLLISTCLLILIIFSLGPQLERIRIEGDLQWLRFKDASLRDDNGFNLMTGVKRPLICCRDLWADLFRGLGLHQSVFLSEEEGLSCGCIVTPMAESETLDPSQSIILSKIRVIMNKLVAELGGKVQCDILNALEVIAEAFIETTQRQYEEDSLNSSKSALRAEKDRESESSKPLEEANALGDFPCNLVDLNHRNADRQGEFPLTDKEIIQSLTKVAGPFTKETTDTEVDATTVHRNVIETSVGDAESLLQESCTAKLSDILQVSGEDNGVLDSDQAYPSESEKGLPSLENCMFRSCRIFPLDNSGEEFLAMDRLWEEDDHHTGLLAFEKIPAVKKEKDWKRTLACKLYEEQQNCWRGTLAGKFCEERSSRFQSQPSPLMKIPEHQSYTDFFGAKSTSSSSDSPAFTSAESPLIAEEMDLLWEEYNDAQSHDPGSKIKGLAKSLAKLRSLRGNVDSDTDDGPETPRLCCLKAFRFSTGKMPLRRPNLVKFSRALKNFGLIQHIRGTKQHFS